MSKSEIKKNQIESTEKAVDNIDEHKTAEEKAPLAMEDAQIEFNRDSLTYICDYCGKVNSIDSPRCLRCGKRRPRKEYINAIKALNEVEKTNLTNQDSLAEEETIPAIITESNSDNKSEIVSKSSQDSAPIIIDDAKQIQDSSVDKTLNSGEIVQVSQEQQNTEEIQAEKPVDIRGKEQKAQSDTAGDLIDEELEDIVNKIVAEEKEKAINRATDALIEEGAKVDKSIDEQIELYQRDILNLSQTEAFVQGEEAERKAARNAVLQIIEAEKAAEDALKINKEQLNKAAIRRIEIEKELAKKGVCSQYVAERQDIQKATAARLNAERESIRRLLEEKKSLESASAYNFMPGISSNQQVTQPFVIVPYVNSNQPLLQYKPNQLYRFIPSSTGQREQDASINEQQLGIPVEDTQANEQLNKLDNAEVEHVSNTTKKKRKRKKR